MLPITFFFYGFFAGCAGLLSQILLLVITGERFDTVHPTLLFIVLAALLEETAKLLFLFQGIRRFTLAALTILHLILFGIGFALLELAFAFFIDPAGIPPLSLLSFNALFHIATVLLLGWGLRHLPRSKATLGLLLFLATLLHTAYNLFRS